MATPIAARPCMSRLLRTPRFVVPQAAWAPTAAQFSTTGPQGARNRNRVSRTRDNNRFRGVSPLRRTGLREPVSVSNEPLPQPRDDTPQIQVDPNHGLYGFFRGSETLLNTPAEDRAHGRAWTVEELRRKSWEDLHKLWWVCCRERNVIVTADRERERAKMGFGASESTNRLFEVKKTMKAIRHVLTERYYLWEDAYELARQDQEINLNAEEDVYSPTEDGSVFEDEVPPSSESTTTKPPAA